MSRENINRRDSIMHKSHGFVSLGKIENAEPLPTSGRTSSRKEGG